MRSARFLIVLLAGLALASESLAQWSKTGLVGPVLHPVPNALGWQQGTLVNTQDYDCLQFGGGFSIGYIIGTFVSYYGDPNTNPATPRVGDIYYTSVFVQDVAACQPAGVQPWLILPAGTSLAISAANPVICYKNGVAATCNQNPQFGVSLSGAYGYNLGVWTLKSQGGSVEVQVPVSSSSSGPTRLMARVDTADGWSNPSATPFKDFLVGANSNLLPTVTYPVTPTTNIMNTTATTTAWVTNQNTAGDIYFDLGTTTTYEDAATLPFAVSASGGTLSLYCSWSGLLPGTLYHWRARYIYGGGATALGIDQTFTTTGMATAPAAPMYVTATTSSPTQVGISWYAVAGATSYEVWRRSPGSSAYIKLINTIPATITATSYNDTTVQANTAYMYKVRAVNSTGSSVDSYPDLATTVIYSDDRLIEFETVIKLAHLTQLRTAVNAVRALANLSPAVYVYTDPNPTAGVTNVKAIHITELRTQFDLAMAAITGVNSSWATTPVQGGPITFVDFQQLRDRLK
jgi:hypothetical protein